MKKLLLLITVITLSFSCADKATIEFDDPKSQAVLGLFEAYMANDMQGIAGSPFEVAEQEEELKMPKPTPKKTLPLTLMQVSVT